VRFPLQFVRFPLQLFLLMTSPGGLCSVVERFSCVIVINYNHIKQVLALLGGRITGFLSSLVSLAFFFISLLALVLGKIAVVLGGLAGKLHIHEYRVYVSSEANCNMHHASVIINGLTQAKIKI